MSVSVVAATVSVGSSKVSRIEIHKNSQYRIQHYQFNGNLDSLRQSTSVAWEPRDLVLSFVLAGTGQSTIPIGRSVRGKQVLDSIIMFLDGIPIIGRGNANNCVSERGRTICSAVVPWQTLRPGEHILAVHAVLDETRSGYPTLHASPAYRIRVVPPPEPDQALEAYRSTWPGVPPASAYYPSPSRGDAVETTDGLQYHRLYPMDLPPGSTASNTSLFRAGTYVTLNDVIAAQAMQNISRAAGEHAVHTVEQVLRSDSLTVENATKKYVLNDSIVFPDLQYMVHSSFYQHYPVLGYPCFYTARQGQPGYIPDCKGVAAAAARKAEWMVQSGLQFALSDGTNRGSWPSSASDVLQMRPAEVFAAQWAALREQGTATPDFGVWAAINGNWTLYQQYLDRIYNDPKLGSLAPRASDGRKAFWTVNTIRPWQRLSIFHPPTTREARPHAHPGIGSEDRIEIGSWGAGRLYLDINRTSAELLASNGGRNDVLVQFTWHAEQVPAWWNASLKDRQAWTYLGACQDTQVAPGVPCDTPVQNATALGKVMTVSANTVLDSVPFASPGKRHGLTLKSQFLSVFRQLATPREQGGGLDFLFLPSWNEFSVIAQTNPWNLPNPYFQAMGLKQFDSRKNVIFVDGYAEAKSRTIEPSVDDGGRIMEVLASCLRVARAVELGGLVARAAVGADGVASAAGCNVKGELCCEHGPLERLTGVWSFERWVNGTDGVTSADGVTSGALLGAALTSEAWEARAINGTQGWSEVCAYYGNFGPFCRDEGYMRQQPYDRIKRGPLMLLPNSTDTSQVPFPTVALVRCKGAAAVGEGEHGASAPAPAMPSAGFDFGLQGQPWPMGCRGGQYDEDYVLGLAAADRSAGSAFPRPLRKCVRNSVSGRGIDGPAAVTYHVIDGTCLAGDQEAGLLGFVF